LTPSLHVLVFSVYAALGQAAPAAPAATGAAVAGGATPAPGGSAAAAPVAAKSLLEYIHAGGFVAYVLLLTSAVALGLVIANMVMLRRTALARPGAVAALETLLRERKVDTAVNFCRQPENDCFLTRVLGAGLRRAKSSQFGALEMRPAMEEAADREADRLERLTHLIRIISDLAPMLGLLGTVIGIIKAFGTIGTLDGVARSTQLSANMSEALVCTALGLSIAIPALVAASIFKRRTDALIAEAGDTAEQLANLLQAPAGAVAGPVARPVASPGMAQAVPAAAGVRPPGAAGGVPGGVPGSVPGGVPGSVPGGVPAARPAAVGGAGAVS